MNWSTSRRRESLLPSTPASRSRRALDLNPREVLERLAEHVLAGGEPVGRRPERHLGELGDGAVADGVDAAARRSTAASLSRSSRRRSLSRVRFVPALGAVVYICTVRAYTLGATTSTRSAGRRRRDRRRGRRCRRGPGGCPRGSAGGAARALAVEGPWLEQGQRADLRPRGLPRRDLPRSWRCGRSTAGARSRPRPAGACCGQRARSPTASSPSARSTSYERRASRSGSSPRAMRRVVSASGCPREARCSTSPTRGSFAPTMHGSPSCERARAAGAELHDGEAVQSLTDGDDAAVVETDRRRWSCSAAIVAAGPWSGALLAAAGIEVPLSVSLQSVAYFDLLDRSGPPVALIEFDGDEPYACWDPERGLKAALHARGPVTDPESAGHEIEQPAIDRITEWVHARYSGVVAGAGAREVETCMYTNTPDERFVFDRRGRIVVGSACNGQGFQFAPETGERLARLALETAPLSAIMAGRGVMSGDAKQLDDCLSIRDGTTSTSRNARPRSSRGDSAPRCTSSRRISSAATRVASLRRSPVAGRARSCSCRRSRPTPPSRFAGSSPRREPAATSSARMSSRRRCAPGPSRGRSRSTAR